MKRLPRIPEKVVVFSGFLAFFLCTLVANFSGPHDSIGYLNGIVRGNALFHQHHLLYHFVSHYWLLFIQGIFPGIKDYYLVEVFTALWGSASMTVLYCFFRNRFMLPVITSVAACTVIAFTYGVWFYSVNIEVYAPPMFFLLQALYVMTKKDFSTADVWKVSLLHAMAILFHQEHILFTIVVLINLWMHRQRVSLSRSFLTYAVIGIVLVGGCYIIVGCFVEQHNSFAGFMDWLQGYARNDSYWKPPSPKTAVYVATGVAHAFVGGHYILRFPGMERYISKASAEHSLSDELFLARHMDETTAIILSVISLVVVIVIVMMCIRFIRQFRKLKTTYANIMSPVLWTLLVYSLFHLFWEPEILEFWIFQSILFWLLLLGTIPVTGFPFRLRAVSGDRKSVV